MTCPIPNCVNEVNWSYRICRPHFALVPRPQQEALNHYAKHKGGPAHRAAFDRAVESVTKLIEARHRPAPVRPVSLPYKDD